MVARACGCEGAGAADAGAAVARVLEDFTGSALLTEIRPLLAATVSLVITGLLDALRFVRFASATSGESSAHATLATRRSRMVVRSMANRIADRARVRTWEVGSREPRYLQCSARFG